MGASFRYAVVTHHGAGRLAGRFTVSEPFTDPAAAELLAAKIRMAVKPSGGKAEVVRLHRKTIAAATGAIGDSTGATP